MLVLGFLLPVAIFWFGSSHGSSMEDTAVLDLFSQGKTFFRKANEQAAVNPEEAKRLYQKSLMRFEKIVAQGGIQNGKLYYNIGNTYFRMKDIGRAILNYRRSEQFMPNDPNLQQNLTYARAKRVDQIDVAQKAIILKTLFFWHYDLSTRTRMVVFTCFNFCLWLFLAVRLVTKKAVLNWGIAFMVMVSVLFAGSLIAESVVLRTVRPGVITSSDVVARKGNSHTYEPSFKDSLHAGTEFTLVEDRGIWYQIELADSRRCWVPSTDVGLVR